MPIQSIITLVHGCLYDLSPSPRFSPLSLFGLTGCVLTLGTVLAIDTVLAQEYPSAHEQGDSPLLMAQQVLDGLPPPPPIPDLEATESGAIPQGSGPQGQEAQLQEDEAGELYMVYVNGDSPLLLEQVKQVAPTATIQPYEGEQVILAGLFDRSSRANEQIEQLDQRGIDADVVSVSSVVLSPNSASSRRQASSFDERNLEELDELPPADSSRLPSDASAGRSSRSVVSVPPAVEATTGATSARSGLSAPSSATGDPSGSLSGSSAYFIVIPGSEGTVAAMREQVILLGATPDAVVQRDRPLGPHLLIGPFIDQPAATRWNSFFQDLGMDARVYYKR